MFCYVLSLFVIAAVLRLGTPAVVSATQKSVRQRPILHDGSMGSSSRPSSGQPEEPLVDIMGVGETQINLTWIPGQYDKEKNRPVGEKFRVKYRVKDSGSAFLDAVPEGDNFTVTLDNLSPGTTYEIYSTSVVTDELTGKEYTADSRPYEVTTSGDGMRHAATGWLIAIIVAIIVLIVILIVVCLVVRNRGAKYAVQEKERAQGREPMLQEDRGFGEYSKPRANDDEKKSLTGASVAESETDSMNDYADGETGKFTEDGSFIGQYGAPNRTFVREEAPNPNLSTFV